MKRKSYVGMTLPERRKLFDECVVEGKVLMNQYWSPEMRKKIVELSQTCCDRFRGGRAVNNVFTLVSFADAIGLKCHTLYEWTRIKELALDKLPPGKRNHQELKIYSEILRGTSRATPKEEIERRYDEYMAKPDSLLRFNKYFKSLKSIHFNSSKPENLNGVDKATLETTVLLCQQIAKSVQKFLRGPNGKAHR